MNTNTTTNTSAVGLVWRSFLAVVLAIIIVNVGFLGVFAGFMWYDDESEDYEQSRCADYYYAGGSFDVLCGYLNRFHLVGDDFDKYNEAVEGAILKSQYLQWSAAAEHGMAGAEETAQDILAQLQKMADSSQYPENRQVFAQFLLELTLS